MQTKIIVIAALSASVAAAKPQRWHHHGTGWRHHRPRPTGGYLGDYNSTTTVTSTSTIYSTVTVQAETSSASVEAATFGNLAAASSTEACAAVSTATETSIQYVTVTAGAEAASTSAADATTTSSAAPVPDVTSSASSDSVSAGAFYNAHRSSASAADATTTSAASSPSYSSPPSTSGGKKGIAFNVASKVSAFGNSVTWCYNWADSESGDLNGVEYVPMMWGVKNVNTFASKVGNAKNVLSFNEPDLGDQANIAPAEAAKQHKAGMQNLVGKVRIGSPAVTNANNTGTNPMGQGWLEAFFDACGNDCPVDFIAFHWYDSADHMDYFKTYVNNMAAYASQVGAKLGKDIKLWLTEFQPIGGGDQAGFMSQAVSFLESHPSIERYAGFMASEGTMLTGNSLNAMGQAYAS